MAAEQPNEAKQPRRGAVITLIVVASLVGFLSVFAVWIARQVLETETWTETSTELLEEDDIREPVAGFLVDEVFTGVDVQTEIQRALPPQAQALAGPAAGGLRKLADDAANEALQRPRVQQLWADANGTAHEAFVKIVEGKDADAVQGGVVTLDLGNLVDEVASQVGIDLSGRVPPDAGQIEIVGEGELGMVQDIFNALKPLAIGLTALALALFGLAIYLARGWRREALRAVGFAFVLTGVAVLAARGITGDFLPESLASTASVESAVSTTWEIYTSLLRASAWSLIGYGVVIVLGAWLAGPGQTARALRRELAPLLRGRPLAYALLGAILLLVFWWNPTPGTARLLSSLVLLGLAVGGMEALRHQAIQDFPNETMETAAGRWQQRIRRDRTGKESR